MEEQRNFRCLRCGHRFAAVHSKAGELVERVCPACRSNSIRLEQEPPRARPAADPAPSGAQPEKEARDG